MKKSILKSVKFLDLGFKCRSETPVAWPCFHQHNEVELIVMTAGSIVYRFGGAEQKFSVGDTICFWSSVPHQIARVEPRSHFEWLTIPLGIFLQWRLPEDFSSRVMRGEILVLPECSTGDPFLFRQWQRDLDSGNEVRKEIVALEVEARLRRLALAIGTTKCRLAMRRNVMPFSSGSLGRIELMNQFIARNYRKPLTINQIAEKAGLHPNYAVTLFRAHCGIGINRFIAGLRVSHAQRLLSTTDLKMFDVAFESGFSSLGNFYAVFKRASEVSPSVYRRTNSQRNDFAFGVGKIRISKFSDATSKIEKPE